MKNKKPFISKRMSWILTLVIVNSGVIYYAKHFKELGDLFLSGWLYGIVFCLASTTIYLFLDIVYQNFKVRIKKEDLK
jgi:beta-galactosidase GanA